MWTTLFMCPPVAIYGILVRPGADAIALCGLALVAFLGALALLRLPWDDWLRSPWREAYLGAWWLLDFGFVVIATILGGGPESPLLLLALVQLVFTGLSFPTASVVIATAITLVTTTALAVAYGAPLGVTLIQLTLFAGTGLMAYLQTRNHVRRAEVLSESEHRLAEAQQIAHIGSWEWRSDTNEMTISEELRRIIGAAPDAPRGADDFLARIHPSDRDAAERMFTAAAQQSGPFSVELRILRGDGGIRSVIIHGRTVISTGALTRLSGVCQDITELRRIEARLRHHDDFDALTGLLSRRRLVAEIDRCVDAVGNRARYGALLLIDIDGFGIYNDSYGPAVGDALLRSIATTLVHRLPATDVIARTGGDEFGVLLTDTTSDDAAATAQELRLLVGDCAGETPITASVGIASFGPGSEAVGDDVLVAADIALHEAKDSGGRVTVYRGQNGPDMTWMQRIRRALEEDRFVLHGQPILALDSGEVSHHELLIRMVDDDGQLVAPGEFLPTAERFGLITAIDRWVTRAALSLIADGHRVAVNLSAHSIGDRSLLDIVRAGRSRGLDPSLLMFEITETAAIANIGEAREFADTLAGIGCELAIDDFGTGFGSLTYLKHIPSRYVKIDREFITDLTGNSTDRHVVRAVVSIARSLGQLTVAEGVEDAQTLALVRDLGVDYVQGFYTGRPERMWPSETVPALARAAA